MINLLSANLFRLRKSLLFWVALGLSAALAKENCELLSAQERDESLESYFINLVGGGSHD